MAVAEYAPFRSQAAGFVSFARSSTMNAVVLAVALMLVLSLCRVHVVLALIIGAVVGGLFGGLGLEGLSRPSTAASAAAPRWPCRTPCSAPSPWPSLARPMRWPTRSWRCSAGTTSRARAPVRSDSGRPAALRGGILAEYPADPHRLHPAAGAAAALCAEQAADRPAIDRLRHHLRPDHPVHVPAGGLRQHLPQ